MQHEPAASTDACGAYGIAFTGRSLPLDRLNSLPAGSPTWQIAITRAVDDAASGVRPSAAASGAPTDADELAITLNESHAEISADGSRLLLDRIAQTATISTGTALDPEFVIHPFAAGIGACAAHWSGALALHGGAVVLDGRAWLLLADRAEGKSTTLAALCAAGYPVLTDDLIVIDRSLHIAAGPRSLDLRAPHAAFPDAIALPRPGRRARHRIHPGAAPAAVPLGGALRLAWSTGAPALRPVDATERLAFLAAARTIQGAGGNGMLLLDVATAPMAILHRPQELAVVPRVIELIEQFAARN